MKFYILRILAFFLSLFLYVRFKLFSHVWLQSKFTLILNEKWDTPRLLLSLCQHAHNSHTHTHCSHIAASKWKKKFSLSSACWTRQVVCSWTKRVFRARLICGVTARWCEVFSRENSQMGSSRRVCSETARLSELVSQLQAERRAAFVVLMLQFHIFLKVCRDSHVRQTQRIVKNCPLERKLTFKCRTRAAILLWLER